MPMEHGGNNPEFDSVNTEELSNKFPSGKSDSLVPLDHVNQSPGPYDSGTLEDYDEYIVRLMFWNSSGSGKLNVTFNNVTTADYDQVTEGGSLNTGQSFLKLSAENSDVSATWAGTLRIVNPSALPSEGSEYPTATYNGSQGHIGGLSNGRLIKSTDVDSVQLTPNGLSSGGVERVLVWGYDYE